MWKNKRCPFLRPKLIKLQARTSFRSFVFLSSVGTHRVLLRLPMRSRRGAQRVFPPKDAMKRVSLPGWWIPLRDPPAYASSSPNPQIKKNSFVNRWLGVWGIFHAYVRKFIPNYLACVRLRNSEAKIWICTLESWEGVPVHWDSIYSKPLVSIPYEPTGTMECNEKSYIEPCSEQTLRGERRTCFLRKKTFVFVGRLGSR